MRVVRFRTRRRRRRGVYPPPYTVRVLTISLQIIRVLTISVLTIVVLVPAQGPSWPCWQRVSAGSAGSGGVDLGATVTLALRQPGVTLGMRRSAWRLWRCHRESIPTRRRLPLLPRWTLWIVWQLWQLPQHCRRQLHFVANELRWWYHICHQWEHHCHHDAQQTENRGHQRIPALRKFHERIRRDTAFTGCTVRPMKGKTMTTREKEDRMFAVFGGAFCALLLGCWAALVIALV